jgi:hypothetical protein
MKTKLLFLIIFTCIVSFVFAQSKPIQQTTAAKSMVQVKPVVANSSSKVVSTQNHVSIDRQTPDPKIQNQTQIVIQKNPGTQITGQEKQILLNTETSTKKNAQPGCCCFFYNNLEQYEWCINGAADCIKRGGRVAEDDICKQK